MVEDALNVLTVSAVNCLSYIFIVQSILGLSWGATLQHALYIHCMNFSSKCKSALIVYQGP